MFDCLHDSCGNGQKRGNVQNQGQQSRKDREELVDDLADCLAQLQDDSDMEQIDRILNEINRLDQTTPDFDVEQSLARFYEKYGDLLSIKPPAETARKPKRRKLLRNIARTAAIIAALLILFLGAAQAAGFNIINLFPWWNEEQFHFANEEEGSPNIVDELPNVEFESLQAALNAYDIYTPLVPTQLPDGAKLQKLFIEEHKGQLMFRAEYTLPEGKLFIIIKQLAEVPRSEVEKNADDAEIYTVDGIQHLIMDDIGIQKTIWYHGIWEGQITGNLTREELTAMINSIYK